MITANWVSGVSLTAVMAVAVAGGTYKEKVDKLEQQIEQQQGIHVEQVRLATKLQERERDIDELARKLDEAIKELRDR
jgi:predicted butyrate kinase (DUF1464 family)